MTEGPAACGPSALCLLCHRSRGSCPNRRTLPSIAQRRSSFASDELAQTLIYGRSRERHDQSSPAYSPGLEPTLIALETGYPVSGFPHCSGRPSPGRSARGGASLRLSPSAPHEHEQHDDYEDRDDENGYSDRDRDSEHGFFLPSLAELLDSRVYGVSPIV